jgi:hypothetical protein
MPDGAWGWVAAVDSEGRTIWIGDAHRGDGRRFIVGDPFVRLVPFLDGVSPPAVATRAQSYKPH